MSCMWGRTPPWWSILLLNNDYCSSEWSKDWLNRFKTQKKTLILQKVQKSLLLAKVWASQRRKVHNSLSCSWTPRYCFFTEEQGGGGGGSWESWLLASDHRLCSQKPQSNAERAKQLNIYPATRCRTAPFMLSVALRLQLTSAEKHLPKIPIQMSNTGCIYRCRFLFWWHTFPFESQSAAWCYITVHVLVQILAVVRSQKSGQWPECWRQFAHRLTVTACCVSNIYQEKQNTPTKIQNWNLYSSVIYKRKKCPNEKIWEGPYLEKKLVSESPVTLSTTWAFLLAYYVATVLSAGSNVRCSECSARRADEHINSETPRCMHFHTNESTVCF